MYALLSTTLVVIGTALMLVVLIRKMPALAELPEDQQLPGRRLTARFVTAVRRINWTKYQRLIVAALAAVAERIRRTSVRLARRSETLARNLRSRLMRLSDDREEGSSPAFSSRIKKRAAFLEEERQLIEQLAQNPNDVETYRRLGNLYVVAGNVRDARAAFTEVLRIAPEDEGALRRLQETEEAVQKEAGGSRRRK
jgi:cytochrome c-type biogenesis protein CcmH/NrfG